MQFLVLISDDIFFRNEKQYRTSDVSGVEIVSANPLMIIYGTFEICEVYLTMIHVP